MASSAASAAKNVYTVSDIPVSFPRQPYGVQLAFMSRLITALKSSSNALLEAPTGCGKTLSLLCASLAWQEAEKKAILQEEAEYAQALLKPKAKGKEGQGAHKQQQVKTEPDDSLGGKDPAGTKDQPIVIDDTPAGQGSQDSDPEGLFVGAQERADKELLRADEEARGWQGDEGEQQKRKAPRIFFASRTHSQLTQVVKELKTCGYKPKMAILAAKQHYCINKAVIKKGRIDEECEALMREDYGCKYASSRDSRAGMSAKLHDIEELKASCTRAKMCPYYLSRELGRTADLVFCPYAYILDPCIRAAMDVNTEGAVLIFDEAHNMEDVAREAASYDLDLEMLEAAYGAFMNATTFSNKPDLYRPLQEACGALVTWLKDLGSGPAMQKTGSHEQMEAVMSGQQMLSSLAEGGLGPEQVAELWTQYTAARQHESKAAFETEGEAGQAEVPEDVQQAGAGGHALGVLSRLLTVLQLMYGQVGSPGDHAGDYRMAVRRSIRHGGERRQTKGRGRQPAGDEQQEQSSETISVGLWCLNPALAFRYAADGARSVILASGTLAPLTSFASELGTTFPISLEAPHVVDTKRQVWAGVVPVGPGNVQVSATFKNADTFAFQDTIGKGLLDILHCVPDGVLCFTASYGMIDKLSQRWKATGLWAQLESRKPVFMEPRDAGKGFEKVMTDYKSSIQAGRGGLLFAVCRGKASEGIDFKDSQARAVVLVGIPFPALYDTKVKEKRSYNDTRSRQQTRLPAAATAAAAAAAAGPAPATQVLPSQGPGGFLPATQLMPGAPGRPPGQAAGQPGSGAQQPGATGSASPNQLLTGEMWYLQQGFRALNQAIGRVIRHKADFGAVILFDARFRGAREQAQLSRWVRGCLKSHSDFGEAMVSLQSFFKAMALDPPQPDPPPQVPAVQQQGSRPQLKVEYDQGRGAMDVDQQCHGWGDSKRGANGGAPDVQPAKDQNNKRQWWLQPEQAQHMPQQPLVQQQWQAAGAQRAPARPPGGQMDPGGGGAWQAASARVMPASVKEEAGAGQQHGHGVLQQHNAPMAVSNPYEKYTKGPLHGKVQAAAPGPGCWGQTPAASQMNGDNRVFGQGGAVGIVHPAGQPAQHYQATQQHQYMQQQAAGPQQQPGPQRLAMEPPQVAMTEAGPLPQSLPAARPSAGAPMWHLSASGPPQTLQQQQQPWQHQQQHSAQGQQQHQLQANCQQMGPALQGATAGQHQHQHNQWQQPQQSQQHGTGPYQHSPPTAQHSPAQPAWQPQQSQGGHPNPYPGGHVSQQFQAQPPAASHPHSLHGHQSAPTHMPQAQQQQHVPAWGPPGQTMGLQQQQQQWGQRLPQLTQVYPDPARSVSMVPQPGLSQQHPSQQPHTQQPYAPTQLGSRWAQVPAPWAGQQGASGPSQHHAPGQFSQQPPAPPSFAAPGAQEAGRPDYAQSAQSVGWVPPSFNAPAWKGAMQQWKEEGARQCAAEAPVIAARMSGGVWPGQPGPHG